MFNISSYLDDQNEPNSIWTDRFLMVPEEYFFRNSVKVTSWGAGGIYQAPLPPVHLTETYSKTKAFPINLFAKVILYLTSLLFLCS